MKLFIALFALIMAPLSVQASELAAVTFTQTPYAFQTASSQKNGAVFFEIQNDTAVKIISAQAEGVSETAELHTMNMYDGIMEMREVESFAAEAGEVLTLQPTGNHIMLIGLKMPLEKGATFPLTLTLENDTIVETTVEIVAPGSKPNGQADHHHHECNCDEND